MPTTDHFILCMLNAILGGGNFFLAVWCVPLPSPAFHFQHIPPWWYENLRSP